MGGVWICATICTPGSTFKGKVAQETGVQGHVQKSLE